MINYIEKGYGLHDAIRQAGYTLEQQNGVWVSSDDVAVQAIIDGYTIAQAQACKAADISAHAKALRDKVVSVISAGELAAWSIKMTEGARYAATGDPATAPMLSAEAAARGITLAELVAKVGGNAANFGGLEAQIGGNDGKHRDAVKALTTFEAVSAYDYSSGWPVV